MRDPEHEAWRRARRPRADTTKGRFGEEQRLLRAVDPTAEQAARVIEMEMRQHHRVDVPRARPPAASRLSSKTCRSS